MSTDSRDDDDDEPDFEEDLNFGKKWERIASNRLRELLPSFSIDNVDYERRPELQRAGIDTILQRDEPTLDIKTQRYKHTDTGNLPIEVWSDETGSTPGWFYTSTADLIVWVYENRAGTNLYKRGYFMPHSDALVEWFNDRYGDYHRIKKDNGDWTTVCRLVPIDDFPDEFLVEFDPRLPNDRETPQSDLGKWTGGESDAE